MALIETANLSKYFKKCKAVSDVSFKLMPNEVVSIIGPSGSGKSTLLRLISNLETKDAGNIYLFDKNTRDLNKKERKSVYKRLQFIFQDYALFDHLNVCENLSLAPLKVYKQEKAIVLNKVERVLKEFGLEDKIDSYPATLSGGQKQRVAIARAIMAQPDVILFDEPTSALDYESVEGLKDIIIKLKKQKIGILIVTHDIRFAKAVSERLLFMENSSIIYNINLDNMNNLNDRLYKYLE